MATVRASLAASPQRTLKAWLIKCVVVLRLRGRGEPSLETALTGDMPALWHYEWAVEQQEADLALQ